MKVRQSNFELMRIISMFMIIIWHIFLYAVPIQNVNDNIKFIFNIFKSLTIVHVNSFVLLSGYFQCKSTFKFSKLLKLIDEVWFYKVIIFLLFVLLGIVSADVINIYRNFFPLDLDSYWFIRIYILLYIFSPFLNIVINSISKRNYRLLLIVMFFLFSFLSTVTNQDAFTASTVNNGFSIISFIFLYFTGAYFRIYPIDNTYLGRKYSKKLFQLGFIFLFFLLAFFNFTLYETFNQLSGFGKLTEYFSRIFTFSFDKYDNPLVVLGSICYFRIFYFMHFKNKIINRISSTSFGIYLIHENIYVRKYIYKIFRFPKIVLSNKIFIHIFAVALIIFIICFIIDLVRQFLFKIIENLKISKWWRRKYRGYLEELGLNIKW